MPLLSRSDVGIAIHDDAAEITARIRRERSRLVPVQTNAEHRLTTPLKSRPGDHGEMLDDDFSVSATPHVGSRGRETLELFFDLNELERNPISPGLDDDFSISSNTPVCSPLRERASRFMLLFVVIFSTICRVFVTLTPLI